MSQNYDEVVIDLASPVQVNVLGATGQMENADPTDCVEKLEVLSVSNPAWELVPHSQQALRQTSYEIKRHGQSVGRLSVQHEIGSVQHTLHDAEDVKVVLRITRVNYNRRPR